MITPRSQYLYPGHDLTGTANYNQAPPLPLQLHGALEHNGEIRSFLGLASGYTDLTGRPNSPDITNDERIRRQLQILPRPSSQPRSLDLADILDSSVLGEDHIDLLLNRTIGDSSTSPPYPDSFRDGRQTPQADYMTMGYLSPTSTFVAPELLGAPTVYTVQFDPIAGQRQTNGDSDPLSPAVEPRNDGQDDEDDEMADSQYSGDEELPPSTSARSVLSRSQSYSASMSASVAPEDRAKKSAPRRSRRDARRVALDAPIQSRTYHGPSRTARKDLPRGFEAKIDAKQLPAVKRALEADEEEDVDPESKEVATVLVAKIIQKREKNTMAARKSRQKKAEHVQTLEATLREKDVRIEELEAQVRKQEIEINILKQVVNKGQGA